MSGRATRSCIHFDIGKAGRQKPACHDRRKMAVCRYSRLTASWRPGAPDLDLDTNNCSRLING